jgi:sodium/hydrogen antiporter
LLGIMLSASRFSREGVMIAALLLVVVRPLTVAVSLIGARAGREQRWLMGWFGIRGIGSIYYLLFVLQYDWPMEWKQRLVSLVLTTVAISVLVHGISATPLMNSYHRRRKPFS